MTHDDRVRQLLNIFEGKMSLPNMAVALGCTDEQVETLRESLRGPGAEESADYWSLMYRYEAYCHLVKSGHFPDGAEIVCGGKFGDRPNNGDFVFNGPAIYCFVDGEMEEVVNYGSQ